MYSNIRVHLSQYCATILCVSVYAIIHLNFAVGKLLKLRQTIKKSPVSNDERVINCHVLFCVGKINQ